MAIPATSSPSGISTASAWCILATLLIAAALARGYLLTLNIHLLLDRGLIQDDAFYYYEIARYFLATGIPSFDGIHPTNGFHPLWQAISIVVFSCWPEGDIPLRIMLGIASLLDLASIVLVYHILYRLTQNTWATLCGAAILALHGTFIRTWFNGLETALHIFTLLLLLHSYLSIIQKPTATYRQHLLLGFLAATAFLARTDSAVIIVVLFAFLYIPLLLQRNFTAPLMATMMALLIVTPWLLWNYLNFGNIVQISGQVKGNVWLIGAHQNENLPLYLKILQGIWTSIGPIGSVFKKMFIPVTAADMTGYVFLSILLILTYLCRRSSSLFVQQFQSLQPFFIGIILLFLYHSGVRQFVRGWYNAPVLLMLILLLTLQLDCLFRKISWKAFPALILVSCITGLIFFYSPYAYTKKTQPISSHPGISAAEWLNHHTTANTRIGAANAGILGYYTNRSVINLDGVVNESAFHARLQNQLHRYIRDSGIHYLADHTGSIVHLCATNMYYRCEEMGRWHNATAIAKLIPLTE